MARASGGLHQTYVSSVEDGKRNVTIGIANKIARALGTALSGMFSELDQDPDDLEDA
jgi:transcriptional regulator with XRE-family HTH domain